MTFLRVAALLVLAALFGLQANAQPISGHMNSVEWLVATSDVVVSGKVVNLDYLRDDEGWDLWMLATVEVDETLKGSSRKEIRFVIRSIRSVGHIEEWAKDGTRVLLFLVQSRYLASQGTVFRPSDSKTEWLFAREPYAPLTGYDEGSMLSLKQKGKVQAFTMDLRPLSGPEPILMRARAAVKEESKGARSVSHDISVDQRSIAGLDLDTRGFSGGFSVSVPIDARLERIAQRWAASPEPSLRHSAVEALAYFKSVTNAAILRKLLKDPATQTVVTGYGFQQKSQTHYYIREAAAHALKCWGI